MSTSKRTFEKPFSPGGCYRVTDTPAHLLNPVPDRPFRRTMPDSVATPTAPPELTLLEDLVDELSLELPSEGSVPVAAAP